MLYIRLGKWGTHCVSKHFQCLDKIQRRCTSTVHLPLMFFSHAASHVLENICCSLIILPHVDKTPQSNSSNNTSTKTWLLNDNATLNWSKTKSIHFKEQLPKRPWAPGSSAQHHDLVHRCRADVAERLFLGLSGRTLWDLEQVFVACVHWKTHGNFCGSYMKCVCAHACVLFSEKTGCC